MKAPGSSLLLLNALEQALPVRTKFTNSKKVRSFGSKEGNEVAGFFVFSQ